MTDVWVAIAMAVAIFVAVITLFQRTSPNANRPKQQVSNDLVFGKPIVPKHERPQAIGDGYPALAGDEDRHFFYHFAEFGNALNAWLANKFTGSNWRVQELPKTTLTLDAIDDQPTFGRRYEVFCGPNKLGRLEITASYPYDTEARQVRASIKLDWVRLLSWDTVMDFLQAVSVHISSDGDQSNAHLLNAAMSRSLWNSLQVHSEDLGLDWGDLEVTVRGRADHYLRHAGRVGKDPDQQLSAIS